MQTSNDLDKRKFLSAIAHGSVFLSSLVFPVIVPVILLFVSDDSVVKESAQESINFQFNVWLYGAIIGVLCWLLIGWLFVIPFFLWHWILPVLAIKKSLTEPDSTYRYPFIFRVL
jgi:uncharacterized protein